jgi:hypothetical protein
MRSRIKFHDLFFKGRDMNKYVCICSQNKYSSLRLYNNTFFDVFLFKTYNIKKDDDAYAPFPQKRTKKTAKVKINPSIYLQVGR